MFSLAENMVAVIMADMILLCHNYCFFALDIIIIVL